MPIEREVKLAVADDFVLPDLGAVQGVRVEDRGAHLLEATYWDTDSLALFNSDHGLRHRTRDGGSGTWTLKGPSTRAGAAVEREELEVEGNPEFVPGSLLQRIAGVARGELVRPVAVVKTVRHVFDLLSADGRLAELVDDRVIVLDEQGSEAARFREVEVEFAGEAADDALRLVVERLEAAGAVVDTTAKYARALLALGRVAPSQLTR